MGDAAAAPVSRIHGVGKRMTVTGQGVEISGTGHSVTCTNPTTTSVRVYGCGTDCTITAGNPRITVHGTGHTLRTTNGTSTRDINVSGTGNTIFVDRNSHDIDGHGVGAKVRVQGNSGQIRVSGTGAKLSIFGNVGSITLVGQNHNIYVQGDCAGDVRIGEVEANVVLTKRNKIVIGGSGTGILRIEASGYRNQITSTRIATIRVEGDENRIRTICDDMTDTGTQNLIGPEVNCDEPYATRDRDNPNKTNAFGLSCGFGNNVIVNGQHHGDGFYFN